MSVNIFDVISGNGGEGVLTGNWSTDTVPTLGAHLVNLSYFNANNGAGSQGGVNTTGTQTILGQKTFSGLMVFDNASGKNIYASGATVVAIDLMNLGLTGNWSTNATPSAATHLVNKGYLGTNFVNLSGAHFTGQYSSKTAYASGSGSATINWATSNVQSIVLSGATTLAFTGSLDGARYVLKVTQDGGGNRTVTWPNSVIWRGGTTPTLTTGINKSDIACFLYIGTGHYGDVSLNYT